MFSFFTTNESNHESNDEYTDEYSDEYSGDDFGEDFLKELVYEDDKVKFYITDARDFVPNIKIWCAQRELNNDHVNSLIKCLKSSAHFIGTFKVVKDKDGKIRLIDGQHRLFALKKTMETNSSFNMNIMIELYNIDDLESNKAVDLFKEANNCLNVNPSNLPHLVSTQIVDYFAQRFPKIFIDIKEGQKCYRPKINKKEFYNKIKMYLVGSNTTAKDAIEQIILRNNSYGMRSRKSFKNVSVKMFEKCKNSGCYLGLDSDYKWVNYLDWKID
jgi:hypothetical protein